MSFDQKLIIKQPITSYEKITDFLESIGLSVIEKELEKDTILPGLEIKG